MKLKTLEKDGATYAEVVDGKPVYIADDGKEIAFDAPHTAATIKRLNGEAQGHREAREAAEAKAKAFEGIENADDARKALETVKNLTAGDLVKADKVEEIRREAKIAAEKQIADSAKASAERIKELEGNLGKVTTEYHGEKIGSSFKGSKFMTEKVAVPPDMVQAMFGQRFKVEDGKLVGYDASGNKLYSRTKPGEIAEFDEALETMVDSYAFRDSILKGPGHSGSGARTGNGGGNPGQRTMSRAEYNSKSPAEQAALMTSKDRPALVD